MNENIVAVIEKIELSHQAIAKTISDFGGQLHKTNDSIKELQGEIKELKEQVTELAPVLQQYNDNKIIEKSREKTGKTFLIVIGAIGAMGGAILSLQTLLKWLVK